MPVPAVNPLPAPFTDGLAKIAPGVAKYGALRVSAVQFNPSVDLNRQSDNQSAWVAEDVQPVNDQ